MASFFQLITGLASPKETSRVQEAIAVAARLNYTCAAFDHPLDDTTGAWLRAEGFAVNAAASIVTWPKNAVEFVVCPCGASDVSENMGTCLCERQQFCTSACARGRCDECGQVRCELCFMGTCCGKLSRWGLRVRRKDLAQL